MIMVRMCFRTEGSHIGVSLKEEELLNHINGVRPKLSPMAQTMLLVEGFKATNFGGWGIIIDADLNKQELMMLKLRGYEGWKLCKIFEERR